MADLFSRKCTLKVSLLGKYSLANIYSTFDWKLKTRFQLCSLNWPEDALSYQHVCISGRQDTAMIYFWFLAKWTHFYSKIWLENSVSLLVLRNRWFSFLFTRGQGSFLLLYGKQAQLQSHPRLSPSGGWQTMLDHQLWQRPPHPTGIYIFEVTSPTAICEHT